MVGLRWLLTGGLLSLGILVLVANAAFAWRWIVTRKKVPSSVPLVGGLCCSLAVVLAPVDGARAWAWVPTVLDPDGIVALAVSIAWVPHDKQGQSKNWQRVWTTVLVATHLVSLACALWLFDLLGHSLACQFARSRWDPVERQCYTPGPSRTGTPTMGSRDTAI